MFSKAGVEAIGIVMGKKPHMDAFEALSCGMPSVPFKIPGIF